MKLFYVLFLSVFSSYSFTQTLGTNYDPIEGPSHVCSYSGFERYDGNPPDGATTFASPMYSYSGVGTPYNDDSGENVYFEYDPSQVPESIITDTIYYAFTRLYSPGVTENFLYKYPVQLVRIDSVYITNLNGERPSSYCITDQQEIIYGVPQQKNADTTGIFTSNLPSNESRLLTSFGGYDPGKTGNSGSEKIYYTYTINTPITSCTFLDSLEITVYDLPEPEIIGLSDTYCRNESPQTISGNYNNEGSFTGPIINNTIIPEFIGGAETITYTYTDPVSGCTNAVSETIEVFTPPVTDFNGLPTEICENDDPIQLEGVVFTPGPTTGLSNGLFIGENVNDASPNSYYTLDPASFGPHDAFEIGFVYEDLNGCVDTTTKTLTIHEKPGIGIRLFYEQPTNYPTEVDPVTSHKYICDYDKATIQIVGEPTPSIFGGVGTITLPDDSQIESNDYLYTISDIGEHTFIYDFTSNKGCSSMIDTSIMIHEVPEVDFDISNQCLEDSIYFTDYTAMITNEEIVEWQWYFDDERHLSGDDDNNKLETSNAVVSHKYGVLGPIFPTLTLKTEFGCQAVAESRDQITLKEDPIADFIWYNECPEVAPVKFENTSTLLENPETTFDWNFGDLSATNDISELRDPEYQYTDVDTHQVNLIVTSVDGCTGEITKIISLKPYFDELEGITQLADFEPTGNGNLGWEIDSLSLNAVNNNWELAGNSNSSNFFEKPYHGDFAYFTKFGENYAPNSRSYVKSGCYDLTLLERPMIKMEILHDLEEEDGVVLQYSLDTGKTWQNLGELIEDIEDQTLTKSGLNWFNSNDIASEPNGENRTGWTSISKNDDGDTSWVSARHKLDEIKNSVVRFRIAFASNETNSREGFAFDNIWIGNRTRLILAEHFYNTFNADTSISTEIWNEMYERSFPLDMVDIGYPTNILTSTFVNRDAVGQKEVDYGYPNTLQPYTVLDGNYQKMLSSEWLTEENQRDVDNRALIDSPVLIELSDSTYFPGTTNVSLDITIDVIDSLFADDDLRLKVAIVETDLYINPNGNTLHMRNMLRNTLGFISGYKINTPMNPGNDTTISITGDYGLVEDVSKIAYVVYVQDNNTEEVLQAHFIGTPAENIITSLQDKITGNEYKYILFPNPAVNQTHLVFDTELKDDYDVTLVDNLGNVVDILTMEAGSKSLNINTSSYSSGLYILYISNGEQVLGVDKLVIQK